MPESDTPIAADCPFCQHDSLAIILARTPHFYLLVDHAPLAEGHLLIIPHTHYACYGVVPAAFDDELLALKAQVHTFLTNRYGPIVFFEHGVFRQTVYHAHLHAIPIGAARFDLAPHLDGADAQPARTQDDLRAWYADRGQYFYLERPAQEDTPRQALIFPPEMDRYWRVLGLLRAAAGRQGEWLPQPARRALGGSKMRSVTDAWRDQYE